MMVYLLPRALFAEIAFIGAVADQRESGAEKV